MEKGEESKRNQSFLLFLLCSQLLTPDYIKMNDLVIKNQANKSGRMKKLCYCMKISILFLFYQSRTSNSFAQKVIAVHWWLKTTMMFSFSTILCSNFDPINIQLHPPPPQKKNFFCNLHEVLSLSISLLLYLSNNKGLCKIWKISVVELVHKFPLYEVLV